MPDTIRTEHNERDPESKQVVETRAAETMKPDVLQAQNLDDLVKHLGADMIYRKTMSQLTIDFRSHVRSVLAKKEGEVPNHQWEYAESDVANMDFAGWVPTTQVRKSDEEKAAEVLGKLTPEQVEAAMKLAKAKKKEK